MEQELSNAAATAVPPYHAIDGEEDDVLLMEDTTTNGMASTAASSAVSFHEPLHHHRMAPPPASVLFRPHNNPTTTPTATATTHLASPLLSATQAQQPKQQQQQQQQQPPQVRPWPPVRSSPIAIPRDGTRADDYDDDDENDHTKFALIGRGRKSLSMTSDDYSSSNVEEDPPSRQRHGLEQTSSDESEATHPTQQTASHGPLLSTMTHSLPSRLLRAPFLGSLPDHAALTARSGGIQDNPPDAPALLPPPAMDLVLEPPASLTHHPSTNPSTSIHNNNNTNSSTQKTVSYGSLRDSHLRGKFLDGPSSYRDSRTGTIHRIQQQQHRVRFQGPASFTASSSTTTARSIGERLRQNTQALVAAKQPPSTSTKEEEGLSSATNTAPTTSTPTTTSALSELMESCASEPQSVLPVLPLQQQPQHYDFTSSVNYPASLGALPSLHPTLDADPSSTTNTTSLFPSHALSTSLTGLELLQRGLPPSSLHTATRNSSSLLRPALETASSILEHSNNSENNAVATANGLSRSLSEPIPPGQPASAAAAPGNMMALGSLPPPAQFLQPQQSQGPGSTLPPGAVATPMGILLAPPSSVRGTAVSGPHHQPPPQPYDRDVTMAEAAAPLALWNNGTLSSSSSRNRPAPPPPSTSSSPMRVSSSSNRHADTEEAFPLDDF